MRPKPPKTPPCDLYCHFGVPNPQNVTQMAPNGLQKAPKIHPKSLKISMWTPVCPMGCPATRKYAPRVPKWGPKAPQMTHLGTQNDTFGYPNRVVQSTYPASHHSTSRREGAGGRGEAFRFAAPPSGGAGRVESISRISESEDSGRPRPCRRPLAKVIKNRRFF